MENEKLQATEKSVTAIVCAYNEERTVRGVMEALVRNPAIDEIIAVDDGSTDQTAEILAAYRGRERTRVILLPHNRGKGFAMTAAAVQARGDILLFIDADLKDLGEKHISLLLWPMLTDEADMVIGVPVRAASIRPIERLDPCHSLSGQRAVNRSDFLELIDVIRSSGYGVETILNLHYRKQAKRVSSLYLPYLTHLIKIEKTGLARAISGYYQEGKEILNTVRKNPKMFWGALRSSLNV